MTGLTFLEQFEASNRWPTAPAKRRFQNLKRVNRGMEVTHRLALTMRGVIDRSLDDLEGLQSSDYSTYQIFEADDLAFKLIDLENIKTSRVGHVPRRGIMSPAYIRLSPAKTAHSRFYYWYFFAAYLNNIFNGMGGGVRQNLTPTDLLEFPIPLPDLPTQKAIAAFLDRETARIDQLIEKKQRLVELLGERERERLRQSITPRRPPGTCSFSRDWFGDVPSHWTRKPLRQLVYFQRGHDLPADQRVPGDIPIISSGGASGWHNAQIACGPAIVTGRYGSIGSFHLIEGPFWPLNTSLYSLRICGDPHFVLYLLRAVSDLFAVMSLKSAVPGIDRNDIHGVSVPVPPLSEQRAVAAELRRHQLDHERIAKRVQLSIDRLKEYRSALITAAVTGQIDVETWSRRGEGDKRLDQIQEEIAG